MCVIWGVPYLLIRVSVADVSPPALVFARTAIGAVILVPLAVYRGQLWPVLKSWRPLLAYSAIEIAVPWVLLSDAETHLSSSLSGLLVAAVPLVGSLIVLRAGKGERPSRPQLLGLLVGLVGVGAVLGLDLSSVSAVPALEMAVVVLCYASGPQLLSRYLSHLSGLGVVASSLAVCALAYLPAGVLLAPRRWPHPSVLAAIGTLGVVCTAVAFLLLFQLIAGDGLDSLSLADRATLSNMAPEYGATAALFPVDATVLDYLRTTGRSPELVELVERYTMAQGLFRRSGDPLAQYSELLELDLGSIEPSVAGPKRPQDRVSLGNTSQSFVASFTPQRPPASQPGTEVLEDGSVVIAAITSCTNTSNPGVMVAAGLLAQKAVARGLKPPAYVKTSMAPGSRVVSDYLAKAKLLEPLAELGFDIVGYGCTTCIGNSGPLPDEVAEVVRRENLSVAAVLSGNRNFEGRIHPQVRAAYLASPPLVVAFALAGTVRRDLTKEPLGVDRDGNPVYLSELWPTSQEISDLIREAVLPEFFHREYERIFNGDEHWKGMASPTGPTYAWSDSSTYIREVPLFEDMPATPHPVADIKEARVLALLGDSITTDHISPAGSIAMDSPAGRYLTEQGVETRDFNSYGSRRGNHEVMIRGTFANVRLRNRLAGEREGGVTTHQPDGEEMTIFEASELYRSQGVPLLVIGGKEYGSGSSRDWAAKGTTLLGVRAVLVESFERIHRSNLVGMGVVPLQFLPGQSAATHQLDGTERYSLLDLDQSLSPGATVELLVTSRDGSTRRVPVIIRVDNVTEVEYLRHGGVLPMVLRQFLTT